MSIRAGTGDALCCSLQGCLFHLSWPWEQQWSTWGGIKHAYVAAWLPRVYTRCTRVGAQRLRMHTVRPTTCCTVAPKARVGARGIPVSGSRQVFTSYSTYTHVQGAYGAPRGAVGGAADGHLDLEPPTPLGIMISDPFRSRPVAGIMIPDPSRRAVDRLQSPIF